MKHALSIGAVTVVAMIAILSMTGQTSSQSVRGSSTRVLYLTVRDVITPGWLSVIRGVLVDEDGFTPQAFVPPPSYDAGSGGGGGGGEQACPGAYGQGVCQYDANCNWVPEFCDDAGGGEGAVLMEGKDCHQKGCDDCPCYSCGQGYEVDWWVGRCYPENEPNPSSCTDSAEGQANGYFCVRPAIATRPENDGNVVAVPKIPGTNSNYNCYETGPDAAGEHSGDYVWAGALYCARCIEGTWNAATERCDGAGGSGCDTEYNCLYEGVCHAVNTIVEWGDGYTIGCAKTGSQTYTLRCDAGGNQIVESDGVDFCCNDEGVWEADLSDC